jgi:hypothetical protein
MSFGPTLVFSQPVDTACTGATITAVKLYGAYQRVFLEIPTMPTGTTVYALGSTDNVTFRRTQLDITSGSTSYDFAVSTANTNCFVRVPCYAPYMKVELKTAVSNDALTFKWICAN